MSADWNKIKTEYITTDISYRDLAQKYGVNKDTIGRKAKDEGWVELRRQHTDKTQTKILEADTKQKVSRAERLKNVADKLLGKVESLLEQTDPLEMDTQSMKHISGVLKDIKEVQMIRSEKDLEEQEARIAKLRKEAEKNEKERPSITITLEGGLDEYAQ